jgi:hypothetical protein
VVVVVVDTLLRAVSCLMGWTMLIEISSHDIIMRASPKLVHNPIVSHGNIFCQNTMAPITTLVGDDGGGGDGGGRRVRDPLVIASRCSGILTGAFGIEDNGNKSNRYVAGWDKDVDFLLMLLL